MRRSHSTSEKSGGPTTVYKKRSCNSLQDRVNPNKPRREPPENPDLISLCFASLCSKGLAPACVAEAGQSARLASIVSVQKYRCAGRQDYVHCRANGIFSEGQVPGLQ